MRVIFQEVVSAQILPEVLIIIVKEVRSAMNAGVCSVYLFDERDFRYVLKVIEGLRHEWLTQTIGSLRYLKVKLI